MRAVCQTGQGKCKGKCGRADVRRRDSPWRVAPSEFAKHYSMLEDLDVAFEWLERAFIERDGMELLRVWPGYDSLITDPRYADLIERLDFPD